MSVITSVTLTYEQSQWLKRSGLNKSDLFRNLLDNYIMRADSNEFQLKELEDRRNELVNEIKQLEDEIGMMREAIWAKEIQEIRDVAHRIIEMNMGEPMGTDEIVVRVKNQVKITVTSDNEIQKIVSGIL